MKLLQRVFTLIKANVNDLIDQAEDPEKMVKQLIADLNNQMIQVKTAVAQSLADQYMMEKRIDNAKAEAEAYHQKARLAVEKGQDDLARTALLKESSYQKTVDSTSRQLEEHRQETESMKLVLGSLENKIAEVNREKDIILARQRRAKAKETITNVRREIKTDKLEELLQAIGGYVDKAEAVAQANSILVGPATNDQRLDKLVEDAEIEKKLTQLKAEQADPAA